MKAQKELSSKEYFVFPIKSAWSFEKRSSVNPLQKE